MSLHFEKIRIKEVKHETAQCVSIAFDIPPHIAAAFTYKAGQYLTIRAVINGEEIRRSYSLFSAPHENEWRVAVKKVEGGVFSTWANEQLRAGDILELMPPMGNFHLPGNTTGSRHYIGIAAGSGITPVISIIKTVLHTQPGSSFTLVYGNRNRQGIIFKEALEALKNKFITRFNIIHILSREITDAAINHGRINAEKCAHLFEKALPVTADEFFICGPEGMTREVKFFLEGSAVPPEKIHAELFNSAAGKPVAENLVTSASDQIKSRVTVKLDGRSFDFDLAFEDASILDAAAQEGADVPYSCKSGVCCTCRAKLLEGKVEMDACYGLEPEEVAEGYILTCQSHPTTARVVVDYDAK
ncbi:MAG TPA: 1,2-phenylacetyl-CoA epoxidase subunit PaaE [Chitinophagaceae bacterium]|nr:1,2-phenylacetyl-CoA epoxidase subunit PaaE [Chitinophagaceae bacterium]